MKKRVLIIRNAYSYDFGGAERFAVNLGCELQKHGWDSVIISRSPKVLEFARQNKLKTIQGLWWSRQNWTSKRMLLFPIYILWELVVTAWYIQLIIRLRASVIHAQSRDDFIGATVAGRLLGKRVIWSDHADLKYIFANHRKALKNFVGKWVYVVSKLAHTIVLVSDSERKHIVEEIGHNLSSKFTVVHNGVSEQSIKPMDRDSQTVIFCSTSRLVTAKGIGELIKAYKAVHEKIPNTMLWIVGDGPETETFKKLAAQAESIVFVGHSDKALEYVASSDVFVHPSYHEGFSLSIVEAAMLGKPIIACNVGGNSEIIEDGSNGILVKPRDAVALATAMEKLATDSKLRDKFGEAAHKTYKQRFNFETIVKERFMALYEGK